MDPTTQQAFATTTSAATSAIGSWPWQTIWAAGATLTTALALLYAVIEAARKRKAEAATSAELSKRHEAEHKLRLIEVELKEREWKLRTPSVDAVVSMEAEPSMGGCMLNVDVEVLSEAVHDLSVRIIPPDGASSRIAYDMLVDDLPNPMMFHQNRRFAFFVRPKTWTIPRDDDYGQIVVKTGVNVIWSIPPDQLKRLHDDINTELAKYPAEQKPVKMDDPVVRDWMNDWRGKH